jgi:hypothetical protein
MTTDLKDIICPRLTPYLWDILGYIGGLTTVYYNDINGIIVIYSSVFVFYGLLNMFFEFFTVSFDIGNGKDNCKCKCKDIDNDNKDDIIMPNYKNIGNYIFYITNKKYSPKTRKSLTSLFIHNNLSKHEINNLYGENNIKNKEKNVVIDVKEENSDLVIENSKLIVELSIYPGKISLIQNTLYIIYLLGITKRNFTITNIKSFEKFLIKI